MCALKLNQGSKWNINGHAHIDTNRMKKQIDL